MDKDKAIPQKRRRLRFYHILIILLLIGAAAFTMFRLKTKAELRARIEAIRAAGYPVTLAELDRWYTIPADAENAAYTIMDAFAHYKQWNQQKAKSLPVVGQAKLPARTESMEEETRLLAAQYIADNNEAIELLNAGALIGHFRYPVDLSDGLNALMPYLGELKIGVGILSLEAILHAENGDSESAVRSVKSALVVARSLQKEPVVVSQLVRVACQALTLSVLERLMNRIELTDGQLAELSGILAVADEHSSDFNRAFIGQMCSGIALLRTPSTQMQQFRSTNSNRSSKSRFKSNLRAMALDLRRLAGLNDKSGILYLDFMKDFIKANQLAFEGRGEAVETIMNGTLESTLKRNPFWGMLPGLSRMSKINLRAMAHLRTARTALTIQRYRLAAGKLPEALKDLVPTYLDAVPMDPFDGRELRYEKLGVGFVVYSIDKDLHDDGGLEEPSLEKKRAGATNWDVTFIVER